MQELTFKTVDKEVLDQSCAKIYPNSTRSTGIQLLIVTGMFVIEEEDE